MHLKDPKWIKKSKAMKRKMEIGQTFTIQSIEIGLIEVWWCTSNGHTEYGELKEDEIKRKLAKTSLFEPTCGRVVVAF
mgnify:CR=1 FL=1